MPTTWRSPGIAPQHRIIAAVPDLEVVPATASVAPYGFRGRFILITGSAVALGAEEQRAGSADRTIALAAPDRLVMYALGDLRRESTSVRNRRMH